jgi:hypothetical protein
VAKVTIVNRPTVREVELKEGIVEVESDVSPEVGLIEFVRELIFFDSHREQSGHEERF